MPMVILAAKQKVNHENGDSSASDDHEGIAKEEESKHIVHLAEPDGGHDEVEFDEDCTEW